MPTPTNPAATLDRRQALSAISALALFGAVTPSANAQTPADPTAADLSTSRIYPFADLPLNHLRNGQTDQIVLHGLLVTGETLEVHETTLPPGQMPHPPHHHRHSELMLVRDGLLEFDDNGHKTQAGPGGVFFVASNVPHAVKCVGDVAANYFVIAIGSDPKP